MTTKDMLKTFFPIILFSIVLPLIDIVTDLRLIIRLYSSIYECKSYEHLSFSTCQEIHKKFATLLSGE